MTKKSLINKLGEKAKNFGDHLKKNAAIYTTAAGIGLGSLFSTQEANAQTITELEGLKFGSDKVVSGKDYSFVKNELHGQNYLVRSINPSRKNPEGLQVIPLDTANLKKFLKWDGIYGNGVIKGLEPKVSYIPKPAEDMNQIVLKNKEDSSVFSVGAMDFYSTASDNPVGSSSKVKAKTQDIDLYTMFGPDSTEYFYPYLSPENNQEVANGNLLNFVMMPKKNTEFFTNYNKRITMENGKVLFLELDKENSDMSLIKGTKKIPKNISAYTVASEDSVESYSKNIIGKKDSTYAYKIPKNKFDESQFSDYTILDSNSIVRDTITADTNLILNQNYPKNLTKEQIAKYNTGEFHLREQPETKSGWDFSNFLESIKDNTRADLGIEAYGGGIENPTGGASATGALQFKLANGLWFGPSGTYTPDYFSNKATSFEQKDPKKKILDLDGNPTGVHSETWEEISNTRTEKKEIYLPYNISGRMNVSLGDKSELEIKLGGAKKTTKTSVTGTKDVYQYLEMKNGNNVLQTIPLMDKPQKLSSDEPVVRSESEYVPNTSLGYKHYFGENKDVSVGTSLKYRGGKDISGNITINYVLGEKE